MLTIGSLVGGYAPAGLRPTPVVRSGSAQMGLVDAVQGVFGDKRQVSSGNLWDTRARTCEYPFSCADGCPAPGAWPAPSRVARRVRATANHNAPAGSAFANQP